MESGSHFRRYALRLAAILGFSICVHAASEHRGEVRFGGVPVPGAMVLATQGGKILQALTGPEGIYAFPSMDEGVWTIQIETPGFETIRREVVIASDSTAVQWELKMRPPGDVKAAAPSGFPAAATSLPGLQTTKPATDAAEGLLINGTVSNAASTPVAVARAIGNNRRAVRSLYTGNVLVTGNSSLFDARSFSLTGQDTPKPAYNRLQTSMTLGGPLQIPHIFRMGTFSISYSRTQNRNAGLQTAQMPTPAERRGDFSQSPAPVIDPITGTPFSGNVVPEDRISPQARALIELYPLPNFSGPGRYNYQIPVVGESHGDNVQGTINNIALNNSHRFSGTAGFQSLRSDNPDLFGFTDTGNTSTAGATVTYTHRFTPRVSGNVRYAFGRMVNENLPYFGSRQDVSADAGIAGGDPDPRNWGPPSLNFSSGIARLSGGSYAFDRSQSHSVSYTGAWSRVGHAISYGVEFRRQQFNLLNQQNARGSFTFTGAATGNDFADFLLSTPAASSLAFGNADKYFRQSFYSVYWADDWRMNAGITLNLGVRWEYESPITERYGRLVNLEIAPGFTSATPAIERTSFEPLLRPDRSGVGPRIGVAWRPSAASSVIVRAGYGLYRDTTVYRAIADEMAQQSPLSKSLTVQNTPTNPLTLADGFRTSPSVTETTFAVDPAFRVGQAHNWNVSIQRDLPSSMQATLTYAGIKGTHVPRRILPNTFPYGAVNPCPNCPTGFVYLMSNGGSDRHYATVELRRRQRKGFEASARYTFSRAMDDSGIPGYHIAQNWLDPGAERGRSSFDQLHQLIVQGQFTTGMLASAFWDGWQGKFLREWTLTSQWTVGSGSPLTPVFFVPVGGTGITGNVRPNVTGAPIHLKSGGAFLNPAAFAAPPPGEWGNAARNSITGPGQFVLNASLTRTFRVNERVSMDLRVDSTNVLNHVTFPTVNTTVNSLQFGLPPRANAMRTLQPSLRVRF
jgi:hypothetical protein